MNSKHSHMNKILLFLIIILSIIVSSVANAGLVKDKIITIDSLNRTYDVYLPDVNTAEAKPLVLLLHGHFGDADVMTGENKKEAPYKIWLSIAKREGWYLVIPDGEYGSDNFRGWNDCRDNNETNPSTDDVKFLNSLIDTISSQYPIDENRIYAHGTSNGGMMAFRLAQESGDRYRGIAAIVASMPEKNKCFETKHPISVLVMNGTEDPILPYQGGRVGKGELQNKERGSVLSTTETIKYWLTNNVISSDPNEKVFPNINRRDGSTVHLKQYTGDKNNTEVVLYEIRGGGHTEPSLTQHYRRLYKFVVGKQNKDIEMAEEVWKFFDRNR